MKDLVKKIISESIQKAGYAVPINFNVDVPPKIEMGDFSTNAALIIGGRDKINPRDAAEKIASKIKKEKTILKIEIAGPGFINLSLSDAIYREEFAKILEQKENYGQGTPKKTKVQVEYVSANPTGPLHIGNARGGPIGEAVANLLDFLGYKVFREFYVNDMGLQIERFGRSLYYWFAIKTDPKLQFFADGYPAPYVKEISLAIQKEKKEEIKKLKDENDLIQFFIMEGLIYTVKSIREDCELIGIKFDNWIHESNLQFSGKAEKAIEKLKKKGFTTKKEGALWFKNPDDEELADKESVLVKSDGKSLTYFADDITYHVDKFNRGFDKLIDVWGANHHGHLPRFKAAMKALGYPEEKIAIIFYQYIRLKKNGKVVSMGKRLGNFVTLREVIESGVEPDAFKYFVLSQNPNTPFDFDLKLAADASEKNPVYYIKYAHARICSILAKEKTERGKRDKGGEKGDVENQEGIDFDLRKADFSLLTDPKEVALYKELVKFPELLNDISSDFQIQALPHYAYKIATLFHDFYANCQVLGGKDKKIEASRLSLVLATKYVLANALNICGIEAPEKM